VFQDEASFRQDPTLYRTWARRGHQPQIYTYGQRNTQHVFGAIGIQNGRFSYRFAQGCNAVTFQRFLEQILERFYPPKVYLIMDNARYHKDAEIKEWFHQNTDYIERWYLPPYSPEMNAVEPLWGYTRRHATHNKFFTTIDDLIDSVKTIFRSIQNNPKLIKGYLASYN
jgi:transposase